MRRLSPLSLQARSTLPLLATSAAAALLVFCLPRANAAYGPPAEGAKAAVATDHSEATRAALETLHAGGNAVDAAITGALTLGVVNPAASGLGGGGFALVYTAKDKKVIAVDFRETAPAAVVAEDIFARSTRYENDDPTKRGASVGTPGEPMGLEWLQQKYGKLPLAKSAVPAVDRATRGFYAGRHLAHVVGFMNQRLAVSPELARTFLPGGHPVPYRSLVQRPELGRTIARFGAEGSRPFYHGDIADKYVKAVRDVGGQIDKNDFVQYRLKERQPFTRTVDGRVIYTMPAPSAGGLMLLEVLSMYGASPSSSLKGMGFGSSAYLHTVAEAMRGAVADRARFAGDPDLDPNVEKAYEAALDPAQIAARKARILPNKTHQAQEFRTREQGTTHLIVVDQEGNVVALTTTINDPFGAKAVAGDTGILINNQLDDFSTPKDLQGFGVIGLGPNRPRANARPVSSMTPTIILENGLPILALGGSGGTRIATGVTQATLARLVFGLDASACVSAPRVHVSGGPDLVIEADVPDDIRAGLRAKGEQVKEGSQSQNAVQLVAWDRSGQAVRLFAASDPRKHGFAAAE
jgi:gamma-glutamyltranspeptidase/glutathione hydrolase